MSERAKASGMGLAFVVLVAGACVGSPPDPPASSADATSTGPGSSSSTTSLDSGGQTTGPLDSTGTTTTGEEEESSGSSGTSDGCPRLELGAACEEPECDCASGNCFVVGPLGGICSECDEDADCADLTGFGCNFGNPLSGVPAECSTNGGLGEGCETADACASGLFCPTIIEVPGIISASTCSECDPMESGCPGMDVCAPLYDIAVIGGYHRCVPPGSVGNNEGCNLQGSGIECMSGQCAPASLMGIPVVGVCSPCNEDADCPGGGTCVLPEISINGKFLELIPGACQ